MYLNENEALVPVGVTIAEDFPIGIQSLPLVSGLNVLYGKNGSGKTRILNAISRVIHGYDRSQPVWGEVDDDMALYSTGGIHLRRVPDPNSDRPFDANGPLPTFYSHSFSFPGEEPEEQTQNVAGFRWQNFEWNAWISAFLLSSPWEDIPIDRHIYLGQRSESFAKARKLGLSKQEWIWLLDQERYFLQPSDGSIFLCDPDPFNGPLRHCWEKSQLFWREELDGIPEKLSWNRVARKWEKSAFSRTSNGWQPLPPLPEILGLESFPTWVAYPVLKIDIEGLWEPTIDSLFEVDDMVESVKWSPLEDALVDYLSKIEKRLLQPNKLLRSLDSSLPASLSQVCRDLEDRVNAKLNHLFEQAPSIRISDARTSLLSSESPVAITAQVDTSGPWFPVSELGEAHRRFVMKAIAIELFRDKHFSLSPHLRARLENQNPLWKRRFLEPYEADYQCTIESPSIAFIDEPESGLHPQAETVLADGLNKLAEIVVLTSHSLKFLNTALKQSRATLVERTSSGNFRVNSTIPALSSKTVSSLEQSLGLEPADVVSLVSCFLLVEGVHDQVVLEHFLEETFRKFRIVTVPMQGTKGVADLVTAPFLFAATSAPLVVVVDNGRQELIDDLHRQLLTEKDIGKQKAIKNASIKKFQTAEMSAILNLFSQAIEMRRLERISCIALDKRDIIDYVPVQNFTDKFDSWEVANAAFLQFMKRTDWWYGDGKRKKDWLKHQGIACTEAGIRRALKKGAANGDPTPTEFKDLAERLMRLVSKPER